MRIVFFVSIVLMCGWGCKNGASSSPSSSPLSSSGIPEKPANPSWLNRDYLLGHFEPAQHPLFARVPIPLAEHSGMFLRKEALEALQRMDTAARRSGIVMQVRSATRNFDRQKQIWESKWTGKRLLEGRVAAPEAYPDSLERAKAILLWSSMPGSSRHHWGTDMDFQAFDNAYFESGPGLKWYNWMLEHASEYGFCQPYTRKDSIRPTGYNEERWHWSYMPVASVCLRVYSDSIHYSEFTGFMGHEMAKRVRIIDDFVMGVHPECH